MQFQMQKSIIKCFPYNKNKRKKPLKTLLENTA